MNRKIFLNASLTTLAFFTALQGATAASKADSREVIMSTTVNARPTSVWQAICAQRRRAQDHRKLVSYEHNEAIIEEEFAALPVIGSAKCLYKESEVPLQRIDYTMVESSQFKCFEGSWILTSTNDGNSTKVVLTSKLDTGLHIPFVKEITRSAVSKHVKARLESVRSDAEEMEHRVASR